MYLFSIVLFTVTSLNYVARPPGPSDPNLDQNYDIFVGTILAFNANVLHAPNRVRSEIRKDPSVTLFFGRTSLSNRNIVLAILLLAGDVHPNPGPINRETIYPCGYCQQHVGWSCSGVGCETCNVWYHRECVSITHSHYLALNNSAHVWICFKCQTPNFSNSSISITGSPEINFNSQNSFAVLSDLTGKDDVFLRSPLATLFNPPLFSTPTGDTSSFSNFRYTLHITLLHIHNTQYNTHTQYTIHITLFLQSKLLRTVLQAYSAYQRLKIQVIQVIQVIKQLGNVKLN